MTSVCSRMGEKYVFTSCCCGCSLRTGALAIAIVSLVLSTVGAAYGAYVGANGESEGWVDFFIDVVNIILAAILIHGIRTERRELVLAWVWGTAVMVCITIIVGIVILVLTPTVLGAVILLVAALVQIYFILVVRSYAFTVSS
ncbi:uncharacterized protein LOC119591628 isoform X2 [Penaeus monodon]|uniref:uncharacterized protein LOC119591628 isoform X2 n=1 Tax=Penaeus monodon TaxID=6687 RepID=UPI0018A749E1|nr:uncharacterized protein LOC119591628 isoform X2 [Penaeus monodon]